MNIRPILGFSLQNINQNKEKDENYVRRRNSFNEI
ncbi:hypothetical protein ES703_80973 [subsurface metagenome]